MKLLTRKELASKLGVVQGTITKWEQSGLPVAEPGRRGTASLFNFADVQKWRRQRDLDAKQNGTVDLTRERARKERAQALVAEQALQIRAGDLLVRSEVENVWTKAILGVRSKLLAWPATLAEQLGRAYELGGVRALEHKLVDAVHDLLTEFATPAAKKKRPARKKPAAKKKPSSAARASSSRAAKKKPAGKKKARSKR